jgi:hypothetical protein
MSRRIKHPLKNKPPKLAIRMTLYFSADIVVPTNWEEIKYTIT